MQIAQLAARGLPALRTNVLVRAAPHSPKTFRRADVRTHAGRPARKQVDFDTFLADTADKFEKAQNKPAVIGYGVGAFVAVWFAEWLIHLPLFNVLLGFPIQFLGLASLPYLYIKYVQEGQDYISDAEEVVKKITKQLPGLDK
ncbi:hypothetical protein ACKKBG_A04040 [Auxenochlorella protothecoides x Auxenochlorella symbiontica]